MADASLTHWVFLRGLARENAHWDDFPERFAASLPDVRVHLLDLPGNGEYWRMDSPRELEATMEFVRQEVRSKANAMGSGAMVYLFSMSLGAMVSIAWTQRHPQEIAGAVLVNTSLGGLCPFYRRLCWSSWPLLLRIGAMKDPARRERLILKLTSRLREPTDHFIETRVDACRRHPVRRMNVLRQLWAAARFCPPSQAPATPLLLLNSIGDRMVDPECSALLARQWGAMLRTHPVAGHDLPLDDPGWTIAQVRNWWSELMAPPGA